MSKQKNKEKVLAVASQQLLREYMEQALSELGYAVEIASNGREGWEKMQSGEYAVLCTDLYMPQMNGFELVARVRSDPQYSALPCLVISRGRTQAEIARAVEVGVSDYLPWPLRSNEVLAERIKGIRDANGARMTAIYGTEDSEQLYHIAHRHLTHSYDFKHPARVNKDQLRAIENLHEHFARLLSSTFSGAMRAVVDVDTAFVDQTTYAEFIASLSNPACSYQFTMGPTNGQAIVDVAMPVAFSLVDRVFGGKGSSDGVEARQLTQIEIGVINRVMKRVFEDLETTWAPVVPMVATDIELETNPEFIQMTAASEIVILLAFEVNSANASGLVSVCYPFFTLESILPRLGQHRYVVQDRPSREERRLHNRLRLGAMAVPLIAEVGRARLPLSQVKKLATGDVLRLPTRVEQPLKIQLGGRDKFYAQPCTAKGDELALRIVGDIPRSGEGE